MHDPGMVYIIGYSVMLAGVAAILFFAKRTLDKREDEPKKMSMKPIYGCLTGSAAMAAAAITKVTVFADFYNTYSIYTPAA